MLGAVTIRKTTFSKTPLSIKGLSTTLSIKAAQHNYIHLNYSNVIASDSFLMLCWVSL